MKTVTDLSVSLNHIFSTYYRYMEHNRIDTLPEGIFDQNEIIEYM